MSLPRPLRRRTPVETPIRAAPNGSLRRGFFALRRWWRAGAGVYRWAGPWGGPAAGGSGPEGGPVAVAGAGAAGGVSAGSAGPKGLDPAALRVGSWGPRGHLRRSRAAPWGSDPGTCW